jgi:hypothetical protein
MGKVIITVGSSSSWVTTFSQKMLFVDDNVRYADKVKKNYLNSAFVDKVICG